MGWDAIHLTREELFEKVWSQPTRKLAEEYGISDVGLAKIFKRLNILRRPQGFWARKYPPKPPALLQQKGQVSMTQFLEGRLKLKVNVTKSAVDCPWNRTFLGYSMTWHKNPRIKIAASSVERLKAGLRQIFRRGRGRTLGQVIEESKPKLRGWIAYFRLAEARGIFEDLDGWVSGVNCVAFYGASGNAPTPEPGN